jgi:hypothetical protein
MPKAAEKPLREELSLRAYGRRRGVSHTAVVKAVKTGRLTKCLVRRGRRILVDPVKADSEWADNTDPAMALEPEARAGGVEPGTAPANAGKKKQAGLYGPELDQVAEDLGARKPGSEAKTTGAGTGLSEVRRQHLGIQTRLAQLDLDERNGELVRSNEVRAQAFKMARDVRNAMLLIPNRVAPLVATETDAHAIRQILTLEITNALEAMSAAQDPAHG